MKNKFLALSIFVFFMIYSDYSYAKEKAPEFPTDLTWLNSQPLTLKDLKGKVVLLDFWTYCCINCMHIIPDLKKLEAKYPNELIVIGVHSAKFQNEKDTDNIRNAILRYGITHPVINDNKFKVWSDYGVNAWPTLALIDPEGNLVDEVSGEGVYDNFDPVIGPMIKQFDSKGLINREAIKLSLEKDKMRYDMFSFPGKIAGDEKSGRLFFTDSDHNFIIESKIDGYLIQDIGQGEIGLRDGNLRTAQFSHPQGLYYDSTANIIYVADTENHAIRKIDLNNNSVETLAGNGHQAGFGADGGIGKQAELNSPWDLTLIDGKLYIAMAGSHQIWTLDVKTLEAKVFAGSGREDIIDGPLLSAALAQPSGITTDGKKLYFVDSEASAVRMADLNTNGKVETIIGKGLFEFGDIDGKYPDARLQHPIGITYHDGFLYIADTYNHKIRKVNPATKEITTVIGLGHSGNIDGNIMQATLNEPNGLVFIGEKMYITDTNNNLIRIFDPKIGILSTLYFRVRDKTSSKTEDEFRGAIVNLPEITISPIAKNLTLNISLPPRSKFEDEAPFDVKIKSNSTKIISIGQSDARKASGTIVFPIKKLTKGKAVVTVDLNLYYCSSGNKSLCFLKEARLVIPVNVAKGGKEKFAINYSVEERD